MAVVDAVRQNTKKAREKLLLRYKAIAFKKILKKILPQQDKVQIQLQFDLMNFFLRH